MNLVFFHKKFVSCWRQHLTYEQLIQERGVGNWIWEHRFLQVTSISKSARLPNYILARNSHTNFVRNIFILSCETVKYYLYIFLDRKKQENIYMEVTQSCTSITVKSKTKCKNVLIKSQPAKTMSSQKFSSSFPNTFPLSIYIHKFIFT